MRWIVAVVLVVHGLIHLIGYAKAFGYASLPQVTQPISREMGALWLSAGPLVTSSAVLMIAWPRGWWPVGLVAFVLSEAVIASAWRDARAGTLANSGRCPIFLDQSSSDY